LELERSRINFVDYIDSFANQPISDMKTINFLKIPAMIAVMTSFAVHAQNVGIGTNAPPAKLSVEGTGTGPAIPGGTSNGILRLGVTYLDGLDIGKLSASPFSAWFQAGYNGTTTDPISLAPLGGNVGIGTINPTARLHVHESGSGKGVVFVGTYQGTSPADPPVSGAGVRMMWYPDKASFRVGRVSTTRWDADSIGSYSFASNYNTKASQTYAFAIGNGSVADGIGTFCGGYQCQATNSYSFCFGYNSVSDAPYSTSLGYKTTTTQQRSQAFGNETKTQSAFETVFGRYNVEYTPLVPGGWSPDDQLFVVGFGVSDAARINALTILKGGQTGFRSMSTPTYTIQMANNNSAGDGKAQAYAWDTYSDIRIKSDIRPIPYGLDAVMKLEPVAYFHHNSSVKNREIIVENEGTNDIGFVAQDIYQLIPEVVTKPEDETKSLWGMSYEKLVPVLVKAIQEQQAMIGELQMKVEELEGKVNNE
jgi:hypothetical protein